MKDRSSVLHGSKHHGSGERHRQYHQHTSGESGDKPTVLFCHDDSESGGTKNHVIDADRERPPGVHHYAEHDVICAERHIERQTDEGGFRNSVHEI